MGSRYSAIVRCWRAQNNAALNFMDNLDIHGMTDAQLRRILLTCDGKGVDVKTSALDELLTRRDRSDLAQVKISDL
jgi:hypothetical protein